MKVVGLAAVEAKHRLKHKEAEQGRSGETGRIWKAVPPLQKLGSFVFLHRTTHCIVLGTALDLR